MPVHNGANDLAPCLTALLRSHLQRKEWELIVVDDASADASAAIAARYADKVISIAAPARGPAYARNRGIETAQSPIVVFVDADVMIHADALRIMHDTLSRDDVSAVFGSYDDRPLDKGIVSRYRNLLHHVVHQRSAGYVESFWAGCGAVKKAALESVGTFDEERFQHPEMEDVELGYRLREAGHRILLDAAVQCTHRKRITLTGMIVSDFSRRGIPWTRLLFDRGMLGAPRGLSLGLAERLSALAAVMCVLFALVAAFLTSRELAIIAASWLLMFVTANGELFARLAKIRGASFLFAAVPLHLLYSVTAIAALVWGTITYPFTRSARASYKPTR